MKEWEVFENPGRGHSGRPIPAMSAGMQKGGIVTITPFMAECIGKPDYVTVFYHAKNNWLGIKASGDGGYAFTVPKNSKSHYVRCRLAIKHFDLRGLVGRFSASYDEDEEMIVIDLNERLNQ